MRRPVSNKTHQTPNSMFRIPARSFFKLLAVFIIVAFIPFALYVRVSSKNAAAAAAAAAANAVAVKEPKTRVTVQAASRFNPYLNVKDDGRQMAVAYRGNSEASFALQQGTTSSRTLAAADFNGDGAPEVITGYGFSGAGIVTIQKGNPEGFAPKDDSVFERMHQGYNPPSLLPTVDTYQVSAPVDFLQLGDFNRDGHQDVLIASRDGSLRLLPGDGQGGLGAEQQIALPGNVTSLTSGEFRAADGKPDIAVGIHGSQGPEVLVFDGATGGLGSEPLHFPVSGRAVAVEFGELDSDPFMDLAIADNGGINIVHGWGRKVEASPQSQVEHIGLAYGAQSIAVDNFTWDRQGTREIAVLADDGSIRMLENSRSDKRPLTAADIAARAAARGKSANKNADVEVVRGWSGSQGRWSEVSRLALDARAATDAAAQGLLTHGKISSGETNELMVSNGAQRKLDVVRQNSGGGKKGALTTSATADVSTTSLDVTGTPVATLALPRKLNGTRDMVVLTEESPNAVVIGIEPAATFGVNTTSDHAPDGACNASPDCTFREAVIAANASAGPDTINLPAGTYTLSIIGNTNNAGAGEGFTGNPAIGDVDFRDSPDPNQNPGNGDATTVSGAGAGTTFIVQSTANDRVLEPNPNGDLNFDWTISGVTIAGGRDTGGVATGGGGAMLSGSKDNITTVTNCVIANNRATGAGGTGGGGISNQGGTVVITNTVFGGAVTVAACPSQTATNCGNSTQSSGGGIGYSPGDPFGRTPSAGTLTIQTTSSFQNNTANPLTAGGAGADLYTHNLGTGSVSISGTTFNANAAQGTASGGGILVESIDTTVSATSFTNNSAGNRGGGIQVAGGSLTLNGTSPSITFTGNTATTAGSSISAASTVNLQGTNTTIGGDLEITTNGSWINAVGSSMSPNNLIIIGTGNFTANNSTTNVSGNFQFQSGTFNAGTGLFNFNGTGSQTINNSVAITFNNLTDSNVNNPLTINNSIAVNGTLNMNGAATTLAPLAATVISGAGTLNGSGTVRVTRTAATADFLSQYTITNKTLTNLLVDYVGAAAQVLSSITYSGGLRINNASGVTSAAGTATVDGVLTLTAGALNVNTSTLVINNGSSVVAGSITSAATGTVNYNQGTAGQNVLAFNYGNLIFSNQNKVLASTGTIGIAGTFTPGTATGHTITGSTINFNGAGAQAIPAFNYNNLTSSNTGARTLANAGTVGVAGAFTPGTNTFTITGSTVDYNGGGAQTITAFNYNNLTSSSSGARTLANSGTIGVANVFTPGGNTYTITGSTINFNGAGAQSIPAFNYFNLISSSTGARTLANAGTIGVAGGFTPGTNVFTITGSTIDFNGSIPQTIPAFNYNNLTSSNTGSRILANAGTIGVASVFTPGTNTYTITGSTIDFNGSGAQTIPAFNFNNLTSSNTGTRTLANSGTIGIAGLFTPGTNAYTVTGSTVNYNGTSAQTLPASFATYNNLTLSNPAGVSGVNATTVNINGNWTNNGVFNANNNTVNFNGSGAQVIGGSAATTFQNLTIAGPTVSLGQNATANGVLTLTTDLTTNANVLTMPASGTSTGAADVIGNVKRLGFTNGGPALSFGNPFNSIAFVSGTVPTDITVNLTKSAPGSGVALPTPAVQRTYTITPTGGSGFSATLRLHYLDIELNGNSEASLGLWRQGGAGWARQGKTNSDTANNWVEVSGVSQFSPWTLSGAKNNTTTLITPEPAPTSTPGQAFDVFFTVTPDITGGVTPTGNVNVTVSGGSETCTGTVATGKCTLTLTETGANRLITATYVGDDNSNGSFDDVTHSVCGATLVTSIADSGPGSLRQIIADACDGAIITFDTAGAFSTPQTILLTSDELAITKNLTIVGPALAANAVTISGGNSRRVFNVNVGFTAGLRNLTIANGRKTGNGGGILNDGTLTVVNSTLTGNAADLGDGGAIATTTSSLTLINTTISNNSATANGGGISVLGGTVTIINSTITNNRADSEADNIGSGGGIIVSGGTVSLKNTIVAGNFNEDGTTDAADDINGTVDPASSFNLIGTGGAGGLTNGVNNNQVGVADPKLGLLADNGGPTQTHALLINSPAIEAGSNANLPTDSFDLDADLNTAETLPVDQRGAVFPRVADSADANLTQTVDIGAYEAHPTVDDIPNQTTSEDTAKDVTFNLGDDTGALITGPGGSVQATSSNTTLVPNANLSFINPTTGTRTLHIIPVAGQNGTTTITITVTATNGRTATDTFDLQVAGVNDPPSGTDNTVTTNEDTAYTFTAADFGFSDTGDTPPNNFVAVKITTLPATGSLTNNNVAVSAGGFVSVADINAGLLKFTPVANEFGTPYTSFTFQVQDDGGGSDLDPTPNTMTINVTAVNDPPSFTIAANPPTVNQDAGPQTVLNFATNISAGPNEAGQTLTFNVTANGTTGTLSFSSAPAIDATTGTLTYTANNGTNGTATFNVTLSDNGSNTPPNSNTSGVQSFTITVVAPNATPVVTATAGNLAYTENAGAVAIDPGLTVTDADNTDLTGATVAITSGFVSAQDTLAFTNQLGITGNYNSGTGLLTLTGTTTVANYQTALRTVTYANSSDNPTASRTITFTASDGITSGMATRGIDITAVNDAPVNTVPGPQTTSEDTAKVFSSGGGNQISVADVDLGANPIKITLMATNGTLTLSTTAGLTITTGTGTNDTTMVFTGLLSAVNTALNGLTFNPTTDFTGAASVQITSDDQGFTGTGGAKTDTDSVNITVNGANDAPVVTATAGNLAYTENQAATAIDPGLMVTDADNTNLTGATVAITGGFAGAEDILAFTNQNGITGIYDGTTGVLTLTGTATVANYQTALRSVTYRNNSENPSTAARTVTFTVNDGTTTGSATRGIDVTSVNDAPINTVPGSLSTFPNTPLTFSGGNTISVADVDAGTNTIQVTLAVTNGTLTLSGTSGLSFSFSDANGTGAGDGTADANMTFRGTLTNVNAALNGMTFTPTLNFTGTAVLTITSNDLGNTGTGGPLTDTDTVNIQVAQVVNVIIQNAQVPEPPSGSVNMVFTVTLTAPAPAGGVSVNFATQDLPGSPINGATAGQDYTATSGVLNFAAGEQFKTILVPVLSDNKKNETNELFQVKLSNPVNGNIPNDTATGTILISNNPGTILISELRTSGPAGAGDDFVEIYNNSDMPHTVNGSGGGYGLFKMGATCGDTPVLIGVIPNGTVIPHRGHFLFTGPAYSLADYGGSGVAAGDVTVADIESDRNVAIFSTASLAEISSANRLDAVGFGPNVGGTCDLFREGTTLIPNAGSVLEYSYFRDECGKKGNPSTFGNCPTGGMTKDSNVNRDDFIWIDTTAANTPAGRRLGAPGPQNLGSPRMTFDIATFLLDESKSNAGTPNRVRDTTAIGPNSTEGTMSIRRRLQNNTGAPVTRLRIRVVDISTAFVSGGTADLRLLTSGNVTVNVNDSATCAAAGFATKPCNVTVLGTTLETPPAQPLGGGFNSSVTTGTITLGTPLAPGASVNLQFLLGVQTTGSFKFFFNVEALP